MNWDGLVTWSAHSAKVCLRKKESDMTGSHCQFSFPVRRLRRIHVMEYDVA